MDAGNDSRSKTSSASRIASSESTAWVLATMRRSSAVFKACVRCAASLLRCGLRGAAVPVASTGAASIIAASSGLGARSRRILRSTSVSYSIRT